MTIVVFTIFLHFGRVNRSLSLTVYHLFVLYTVA